MDSNEPETISAEVLGILQRQQASVQVAQQAFQQVINATFEQYGLSPNDKIDLRTGVITRAEDK